jgi:hypothetical protein
MNLKNIDWQVMQDTIIIFFISLAISCLSMLAGWHYNRTALLEFNNVKKLFQTYSNKYLETDEEEILVRDHYRELIELHGRGLVGQERRLDWIETLRVSAESIKLPSFRYVINPQEKYVPDFAVDTGAFQIYASHMKLSIDLLHEGDLQRLLDDLNVVATNTFSVAGCKLTRITQKIQQNAKQANITAECDLKWFNIRKADGSEISLL